VPLASSLVGSSRTVSRPVDARWTTAFAAGLGDPTPRYLDPRRSGGLVAHPLFPVCVEWPAVLGVRRMLGTGGLVDTEAARGVHVGHDLEVARLVRPGDVLATTASVVGVERHRRGAWLTTRLDTIDADGAPVCTTRMGTVFLGVDVEGPDRPPDGARLPGTTDPAPDRHLASRRHEVGAGAAHVYSACARIWNPIHTDPVVAARAGLPGPILHGTATLGIAVSAVVDAEAGGDPERVARVTGRFAAMVPVPSVLEVRVLDRDASGSVVLVGFEVRTGDGAPAVRDGTIALRRP